ncbi:MAG: hypothetical protein JO041_00940 [Acidobacteria bacterium]|nr:hypothetical protein [Acidobacteriota bacterium]
MLGLGGFAALLMLAGASMPGTAQARPLNAAERAAAARQAEPQSQAKQPERDARPVEPARPRELPPAPEAGLRGEIEAGVKAQPQCAPAYHPCALTRREKLRMFEKQAHSPYTLVDGVLGAAYSQITGDDYGPGVQGMAKRLGANLADAESRSFFQTFMFSTIFRQDPRFHRLQQGGILYRAAYAASRVAFGRTDAGRSAVNWPEFFGTAATVTLGNAYYPERDRGAGRTLSRTFGSIASDAETNITREFWPDIRRLLRRHEPKSVQRIENRIEK